MNCFCAIVTQSHQRSVYALAASLRESGNPEPLHVWVADADADALPEPIEQLQFHSLVELAPPVPPLMPYYFDAFELVNGLKPFVVGSLFDLGFLRVIYLDTDIFSVGRFEPVWRALDTHAVIITPHQLRPPPDVPYTNEKEVVDQGIFNGGFSAWRDEPDTRRALEWYRDRITRFGFNDRREGMFVDQKLLPLLPHYFPGLVHVDRNPRLNVAFWNAHERAVEPRRDAWQIDGQPVVFFHLSGFRLEQPTVPCVYLPPLSNAEIHARAPWFAAVLAAYAGLLERTSGSVMASAGPYRYAHYQGFRLFPALRRIIFQDGTLSWRSASVWRALAVERLKRIKRAVLAWMRPTS